MRRQDQSKLIQLFVGCATTGSSTRPSLTAEQFNRVSWEEIVAQAVGSGIYFGIWSADTYR